MDWACDASLVPFFFNRTGTISAENAVIIMSRFVCSRLPRCWSASLRWNVGLYVHNSVQFKMVSMQSEKPMCASTPPLRSFPSVAFETVPMFVWLTMALSRPLKEDSERPLYGPLETRKRVYVLGWGNGGGGGGWWGDGGDTYEKLVRSAPTRERPTATARIVNINPFTAMMSFDNDQ